MKVSWGQSLIGLPESQKGDGMGWESGWDGMKRLKKKEKKGRRKNACILNFK